MAACADGWTRTSVCAAEGDLAARLSSRLHPHSVPVFRTRGALGFRLPPIEVMGVWRRCSVVPHSIVFEYARLSRAGMTRHYPVCIGGRLRATAPISARSVSPSSVAHFRFVTARHIRTAERCLFCWHRILTDIPVINASPIRPPANSVSLRP